MKHRFSYKIKAFDIFLLFLGFVLAFYDMWVLQTGVSIIVPSAGPEFGAPLIAFILATFANVCAFEWGRINGKTKSKHIVNKKSAIGLLGWLAFAVVYGVIEYTATINQKNINWTAQIGQYAILVASYVMSGLMIEKSAREMFDIDAAACRSAEGEYKSTMKRLARMDSRINYMLSALENYNQNYDSLNDQYEKQLDAINHAEDSTINEILGRTLQNNPEVTPTEAQKVVEQAKRDYKG